MKIGEVYLKFLERVNKNYTNDNISVDFGRFVSLFNSKQIRFVEWVIDQRNEDDIRYIQNLKVLDLSLSRSSFGNNVFKFKLPSDYLSLVNVRASVSKGDCSVSDFLLWEVKSENVHELLADEFNRPSFKWRESFYTLASGEVSVYTEDFNIDGLMLTYYRYPRPVDIGGYIKEDGSYSTDVDPEWDDKVVDRIITACAGEFHVNNDVLDRFQIDELSKKQKF